MRRKLLTSIGIVILFLTCPALAIGQWGTYPMSPAQAPDYGAQRAQKSTVDFSGWLKTYFIWKNDQDFDSQEPIFNEYGQSVGFIAVAFDPQITWRPHQQITVRYLGDITGSLWSRTNVDPQLDQVKNQPVYLQKEFWTQVVFPKNEYGFRIGFQHFEDPTKLYIKKYVGALRTFYQKDLSWLALTIAEIPDSTYESIDFSKNNFSNDNFVFALDGKYSTTRRLDIHPGVFFQWDRSVVDKTQYLFTASINIYGYVVENLTIDCDLVFQAGAVKNTSLGNTDTSILAGALQTRTRYSIGKGYLEGGLFVFSPDDGDPYNGRDTSFQYSGSGYSKSKTLLLSENKLFDQYDNLDERAAACKAGWFLADLTGGLEVYPSIEIFSVIGYAMVLQKKFANGGQTVGMEYDLGVTWHIYNDLFATLIGGVLVPGHAGSAFYNELGDLNATDPMYYFQGMVFAAF